MSTIEERLSRDIEAVTGGIAVTDSDLRDARAEVDQLIENRRQRNRRRGLVAAAAAVTVVAGVAVWQGWQGDDTTPSPAEPVPSPALSDLSDADAKFLSGDAPTPELLQGWWRLDNPTTSRMLFSFTADGAIRYDDTGQLSEDPLVEGTYEIVGDLITVDVSGGSAGCAGQTLSLRAAVNESGGLNVLPVDAASASCGSPVLRPQWVLEQELPMSEGLDGLKAPPGASWDPPVGHETVGGTWMAPSGGYVVEMRMDGSYSLLAGHGEVVDRGTWADDDSSTRLTLTSSADSPTCRAGDQFVLSLLRARTLGALVLQGDLERNDCGAASWPGNGWFKLAP